MESEEEKDIEEYEFDEGETYVIKNLSKDMHFVGRFLIVMSALNILGGVFRWLLDGHLIGFLYICVGICNILIGRWTTKAASFFKLIVEERGTDIRNLRKGIKKLSNVYELQKWIFIIFIPLGLLILAKNFLELIT